MVVTIADIARLTDYADRMTLIASARSMPGLLRQDVLIDGRFHLVTDEPVQLGGTDQGPTPHELLVAALAACTATAVSAYVRTKQWDVGGMRVDVEYEQKAEPREFRLKINLEKPITDEQRERLDKVAASCAVRRALLAGFEIRECIVADGVADCGSLASSAAGSSAGPLVLGR